AAFDNVLLVLDAAGAHPLAHLLERRAVAHVEVPYDEAARGHALADEAIEPARAGLSDVILRNAAAQADAGERVEVGEHGVAYRAAHVVEVDIDPVRAGCLHRRGEVALRLVVDAGVEPQLVLHVGAFPGAAGDPNGAAAGDSGELADDLAHRARGRRHHHRLARPGLAHLEQAEVGGHAGHAEHAVGVGDRPVRGVDLAGGAAGADGILLPAQD